MIPEDARQAQARSRTDRKRNTLEQVTVLLMGAIALLGFLLV